MPAGMSSRAGARALSAFALLLTGVVAFSSQRAAADEGGVSFWVPGTFGSLAATPQQPGWSLASIYYYTSVSAGGGVSLSREFTIGKIPPNLTANLNAKLNSTAGTAWVAPSYVFAAPILGGQAAISLTGIYGRMNTSVAGTLTGALATPFGSIPFMRSDSISDSLTGFGDLYPQVSLRWSNGVHNYMTYVMGDVPVGAYDSKRLSNLGIGHGAIDSGGGYTYFDPQTGHEFSAVLGFTYNLENQSTKYKNGIDMHLDWGASQFLSEQWQVGVVGYFYDQLTGDSGSGNRIGPFKSRVAGIGPQIGFLFPAGNMQGYVNLKGYDEFDAKNRASGWNVWLTLSISPAAPTPITPIVKGN
jgi:hypothetical protein